MKEKCCNISKAKQKANAFTLIELAIVISIIGLLTSALFIGSRINENAKIRSFAAEFSFIELEIRNFKDRYRYIPGDFPDATDFFSDAVSADNGNGNNILDNNAESEAEISRIANHLAYANPQLNLGRNSANSFDSNIFSLGKFEFQQPCSSSAGLYNDNGFTDTVIFHNISGNSDWTPAITTVQAFKADLKIDDGKAATGQIRAFVKVSDEASYNCVNSASACSSPSSSTDYKKDNQNLGCALALGLNNIFKN